MHHDLFGEGPAGHGLMQLAAVGHGEGAVIAVIGGFAPGGPPAATAWALPAGANEGDDDRVAFCQPGDTGPDAAHPARRLVAIDRRKRPAPAAIGIGNV